MTVGLNTEVDLNVCASRRSGNRDVRSGRSLERGLARLASSRS